MKRNTRPPKQRLHKIYNANIILLTISILCQLLGILAALNDWTLGDLFNDSNISFMVSIISIYFITRTYSVKNTLMYETLSGHCEDIELNNMLLSHARGLIKLWWWNFILSLVLGALCVLGFLFFIVGAFTFKSAFLITSIGLITSSLLISLILSVIFLFIYINKRLTFITGKSFSLTSSTPIKKNH